MASDREQDVIGTLRALIVFMCVLGALAGLLARPAFQLFVIAFFLPAAWVYWRPRWLQILVWAAWSFVLMIVGVILSIGATTISMSTTLMVGALLVLALLPAVRSTHKQPRLPSPPRAKIPGARVVRK